MQHVRRGQTFKCGYGTNITLMNHKEEWLRLILHAHGHRGYAYQSKKHVLIHNACAGGLWGGTPWHLWPLSCATWHRAAASHAPGDRMQPCAVNTQHELL